MTIVISPAGKKKMRIRKVAGEKTPFGRNGRGRKERKKKKAKKERGRSMHDDRAKRDEKGADSRVAKHPKCEQCLCEIIIEAYRGGLQNSNGIRSGDFPRRITIFAARAKSFPRHSISASSLRCGNYTRLRLISQTDKLKLPAIDDGISEAN